MLERDKRGHYALPLLQYFEQVLQLYDNAYFLNPCSSVTEYSLGNSVHYRLPAYNLNKSRYSIVTMAPICPKYVPILPKIQENEAQNFYYDWINY